MTGKVLIVADAARSSALSAALTDAGYEVSTAESPLGAMGRVRASDLTALVAVSALGAQALRGVFQLARRRSPEIALCVLDGELAGLDAEVPGGCAFIPDASELCDRLARGEGRPGVPAAPSPPAAKPSSPAPPSGGPVRGDGARWLMVYSARGATGWLEVEGQSSFERLYLQDGAPVWVTPVGGDREVYRQLREANLLLVSDVVEAVPEGRLLASLYARGTIAPLLAERFVRKSLKDALRTLLDLDEGQLRFTGQAPAGEPIVRVDPFGMIFEHQRASHTPDALLRKGRTMRGVTVHPRASLGPARESVRPFVRGLDATEVIDGCTIEEFNAAVGHDEVMGTTVILALEAAGLVELESA